MAYLGKSVEREMYFGAKPVLFVRAKLMRNNPTEAEKALWNYLKKYRSSGYIFRRQHPIDIFIADFYCHKIKLVVEVDGEIHQNEDANNYDIGRSADLEKLGIRVIRFTNDQILKKFESVQKKINQIISRITSPSLLGEGD